MSADDKTANGEKMMSRRRMLTILGLTAGAAYAAPVLLQLGDAKASTISGPRRPRRSRPSHSRPSGPRRQRQVIRQQRQAVRRRSFSR